MVAAVHNLVAGNSVDRIDHSQVARRGLVGCKGLLVVVVVVEVAAEVVVDHSRRSPRRTDFPDWGLAPGLVDSDSNS